MMNLGCGVVGWAGAVVASLQAIAAPPVRAAQPDSLPITLAEQVPVGGMTLRPAAPPRGFRTDATLGVVIHESMSGRVLHFIPGYRADVMRAVKTPGGDYLAVTVAGEGLTGGKGHYAPYDVDYNLKANELLAYRSSDQGRTWTGPKELFQVTYSMHGFIPLIPRGTKRIYTFGTEPVPALRVGQENCPIAFRYSDDDGHTWSEPTLIRPTNDPGFTGMSCMNMTETEAGTWLLGTHNCDHKNPKLKKPSKSRQYVLRSEDRGATWTLLPDKHPGGWFAPGFDRMDEGVPMALSGPRAMMFIRTAAGQLWETRSEDDGRTWTSPNPTHIVHPDAPPMFFKLADGKTLAVFHHNRYDAGAAQYQGTARNQLWVTFSKDEGRTWSESRFVMTSANANPKEQISYIDLLADGDEIHLFVPYGWKQNLYIRLKESDFARMPTKPQLAALLAEKR